MPYESSAAECSNTVQQANHDMDDISTGGKNNTCPRWTIRDKKIWENRFLHTNKIVSKSDIMEMLTMFPEMSKTMNYRYRRYPENSRPSMLANNVRQYILRMKYKGH